MILNVIFRNHVLFDLNFIIYNQMFILEEQINNIVKIVLNLPFSYTSDNKTEEKLQEIFDLPWWKNHCENIEFIFDGNDEDEILSKLFNFISVKQLNGLNKLELMIIDCVINNIENIIEDFHIKKNIQSIGFFIDGIPSYSKIIEQEDVIQKIIMNQLLENKNLTHILVKLNIYM